MGSPSSSTRTEADKEEKLDYPELVKRLAELGLDLTITRSDYSRAGSTIKMLIKALLDRLESLGTTGRAAGLELTDEEIEYIIYRLRTIYGDPRAATIVSKLHDLLRARREKRL